ncbi:sensor domain-containing protein [Methylobacterium sp. WSM2598]|uniref:sensor domain-containing protein n=1 Tax=Methylobacterium sp. WSM2598 TaxID=398261 RepID=UPI0012F6AEC7|nr:EAL domain-containing protein [Methylobacterium sp. WSM2598]
MNPSWFWQADADLRMSSLDGRFEELTGRSAGECLGRPWPGLDGPGDPVGDLAPLAARRPFRDAVLAHRHPDGRTRWFRLAGAPVLSAEGAFQGYRGVGCDVTAEIEARDAREARAEARLAAERRRSETLLAHIADGVLMLDETLAITAFNRRFLDLYGLSAGDLRVGQPLETLVRACAARGLFPGKTPDKAWAAVAADLARRVPRRAERRLADGRTVALTVTPTPDGGFVMVHEDATDRKRADARMAEQNRWLDTALTHMSHGLVLFDAAHRITLLNRQFLDLYGLRPERVRPGLTAEQLIRERVAVGNFPGLDADEVWAEVARRLASRSRYRRDEQLIDGRTIAVTCAPTPDGGFVTVHEDVSAHKRAEAQIVHMARHDALTGLPNRTVLHEGLTEALARIPAAGPAAVLCLDLDRFKAVNDTLGHAVGDLLLKQVTARLDDEIGRAASAGTALLARLGGDEFAVVLQPASRERAGALAGRLIEAVGRDFAIDGKRVNVGLSIGIALAPSPGALPADLMRAADMALYGAKGEGRGAYRFFEPEMDVAVQARRAVELDLRAALASPQFELHFQPFLTLASDRIAGFEALVRWRHPVRGLVAPSDFIPVAEETGMIVPLGEWVLRAACREAARWPETLRIAVNLSPVQFRHPALAASVLAALDEAGLAASRLELEITEGVLLQDSEATLAVLHRLKQRGVRIAMDDFGTGYSSLSYLRAFPFDKIKIDRAFVADLAVRPDALAIVRAVTSLGAGLGITTTAEGVETRGQLELLREAGCAEVQGYLISPPLPRGEIRALLARDAPVPARPHPARTAAPRRRAGPAGGVPEPA